MESIIKENLKKDISTDTSIALGILYLQYIKSNEENDDCEDIDFCKLFDYQQRYKADIKKLSDYFGVSIDDEYNPFSHEVVTRLKEEYLIDIQKSDNLRGNISIRNKGIDRLKEIYNVKDDVSLSKMIVSQTINNVTINVTNTITNINQGLSESDKKIFIELLNQYSDKKDKKSFMEGLSRIGEGVFINLLSEIIKPENISNIIDTLSRN